MEKQKILFILTGAVMDARYVVNIHILNDYIKQLSTRFIVHVACISGKDDFDIFEDILPFTYKVISPRKQLDKICDFVSSCTESYDWYVKIRAEVRLLEQLDFDSFCPNSINARARVYNGPLQIKHGAAVGGDGYLNYVHAMHYSPELKEIILDDQLYIFHRRVVEKGVFAPITDEERARKEWYIGHPLQHEWFHTGVWKHRHIPLNLTPLYVNFGHSGRNGISAHLNLPPCPHPASECPALRIS
jgi:hypothetical protein